MRRCKRTRDKEKSYLIDNKGHYAILYLDTQGCTATSPQFKLNSGARISVAGPSSGTIYQAMASWANIGNCNISLSNR